MHGIISEINTQCKIDAHSFLPNNKKYICYNILVNNLIIWWITKCIRLCANDIIWLKYFN